MGQELTPHALGGLAGGTDLIATHLKGKG